MISIIVAMAKDNVIGKGNLLPWHYKEDLAYFKKTTLGHTVLMGEKTFESILSYTKKPLPGRKNVVASKTGFEYPGIDVTNDVVTYLSQVDKDEELFVIGGKTIYDLTLDLADRLYITHIDKFFEGDVRFPPIDYGQFKKIKEEHSGDLRFCVYERI